MKPDITKPDATLRQHGRRPWYLVPMLCIGAGTLILARADAKEPKMGQAAQQTDSGQAGQHTEKDVNHAAGTAKADSARVTDPRKLGYVLAFHDEFDGTHLDASRWIDSYPDGVRTHSNNEQQYYAPDGYEVRDGRLRLRAERRAMGGMPYTSGMVTTYGKFSQQYGWFEARLRIPRGKGMWPAFWLLPDDKSWPPEIDILEILGHEPDKDYMTNHYKNASGRHEGKGDNYKGPDFSAGYHVFALEWKPDEIIWYVDGVQRYHTTENVPHVPMYVLLNLAVGGDWPGNPDSTTPFPGNMDIDYVRVYHKPTNTAATR